MIPESCQIHVIMIPMILLPFSSFLIVLIEFPMLFNSFHWVSMFFICFSMVFMRLDSFFNGFPWISKVFSGFHIFSNGSHKISTFFQWISQHFIVAQWLPSVLSMFSILVWWLSSRKTSKQI